MGSLCSQPTTPDIAPTTVASDKAPTAAAPASQPPKGDAAKPAEQHAPAAPEVPDDGHLFYGLTYVGISACLDIVGFDTVRPEPLMGYLKKKYKQQTYKRDEKKLKWVTDAFGAFDASTPQSATGYDVCSAAREWLERNGKTQQSIVEVLTVLSKEKGSGLQSLKDKKGIEVVCTDERMPLSRPKPDAFYSHQQWVSMEQTFLNMMFATTAHQAKLPPQVRCFYWIDLFCLRQCQKDFNLGGVISLVKQIGCTVAEIDTGLKYVGRTFCVFEVYASFAGNCKFLALQQLDEQMTESMEEGETIDGYVKRQLKQKPVDCASATTRDPHDKEKIDNYIKGLPGGFAKVNKDVTEAVIQGAEGMAKFYAGETEEAPDAEDEIDEMYGE